MKYLIFFVFLFSETTFASGTYLMLWVGNNARATKADIEKLGGSVTLGCGHVFDERKDDKVEITEYVSTLNIGERAVITSDNLDFFGGDGTIFKCVDSPDLVRINCSCRFGKIEVFGNESFYEIQSIALQQGARQQNVYLNQERFYSVNPKKLVLLDTWEPIGMLNAASAIAACASIKKTHRACLH